MKNIIILIILLLGFLLLIGMEEYVSKKEYCQKYAYTSTKFNSGMYKIMKGLIQTNLTEEVNCKFFGYYENYTVN